VVGITTNKKAVVQMSEQPEAPATTSPVDFIMPNQDLIEKVIDARIAQHAELEKSEKKTTSRAAGKTAAKPENQNPA